MPVKTKSIAADITREVCEKELLAGRNPNTVAAACLCYTMLLLNTIPNKKEISEVSKIGESTIQQALTIILSNRNEITPIQYKSMLEAYNKNPLINKN